MTQIAVRVENRSGKQAVSKLKRNQLTAVKMPRKNEVVATLTRRLPDTRVVCAENPNIAIGLRCSLRTGDRYHSRTMHHSSDSIMYPLTSATHDCVADSIKTDMAVVISTHREHRCILAQSAHQITQPAQFGRTINQVATQEHCIRSALMHGFNYLPAQLVGTPAPKMNIADVHQPTRIVPRRKTFFADVKGAVPSDFQHAGRQYFSPSDAPMHNWVSRQLPAAAVI